MYSLYKHPMVYVLHKTFYRDVGSTRPNFSHAFTGGITAHSQSTTPPTHSQPPLPLSHPAHSQSALCSNFPSSPSHQAIKSSVGFHGNGYKMKKQQHSYVRMYVTLRGNRHCHTEHHIICTYFMSMLKHKLTYILCQHILFHHLTISIHTQIS